MATMLITQALDERDLLKKKINDAISSTNFISVKKKNKNVDINNGDVTKVSDDIKATYQSINDMIKRYTMIVQKIAESNVTTTINVNGKDMTISAAISVIKDINTNSFFFKDLQRKLEKDFQNASDTVRRNNNNVEQNKNTLLNGLISRNDAKTATDKEVELVNATVDGDYAEFVDPLTITDRIAELKDYNLTIKANILSAIKISNATTTIEIDD